ncbi:MAG: ECF subfamily RNA polymerase sigma-70 factor [Candidatus Roizmanbacteria bacterium GW2011_GWC2_34_23]|uniref:ECF subfamily RNA polymerase sigma-70 factor n=1 Tax=Candidatus Roizmanbacteria bacterium GW2011_GWC2_34_23 TaxID=1618484 RepID=A0A0G0AV09_9BACT|nr:MAG: ECF subfamily RNA polymerase sigma-70 factor [Candidatus Roizmanbacteria bacterium GW2011_GWC2_34_23]
METNKEERELLGKIIKKDEKALFYVYKKYHPSVFSFVRSQISNYQIAEEIAQDVFIDFFNLL